MIKVSILVAVYNSENYIERCLDSLIAQTLSEIQIICIDDGSSDNSRKILESYKSRDERIEIYSQENKGASSARNLGLKYSQGEYICMVDSDDYISENCLKLTYELIKTKKLDAGIFELILTDGKNNKNFNNKYRDCMLTGKEACILTLDWQIPGVGLYKSEILKTIKYNEENINGDELSTRKFLYSSRRVGFSLGEYYYYKNQNSVTRKISLERFDQLKNKVELHKFLVAENIYNEANIIFNRSLYDEILSTIKLLKSLDKNYFSKLEVDQIKDLQARVFSIIDLKLLRKEYLKKRELKKVMYTFLPFNKLFKVIL